MNGGTVVVVAIVVSATPSSQKLTPVYEPLLVGLQTRHGFDAIVQCGQRIVGGYLNGKIAKAGEMDL